MTTPSLTESEERRIMRNARQEQAIAFALAQLIPARDNIAHPDRTWWIHTNICSAITVLEEVAR
jgi:hypothetical protein